MIDALRNDSAANLTISSEVRFYTVEDVMKLTSWSKKVVLKMFNDSEFPAADFGRAKVVEAHALIDYFSIRRESVSHDKNGDLKNELERRIKEKEKSQGAGVNQS